jgi:hypothetical protein
VKCKIIFKNKTKFVPFYENEVTKSGSKKEKEEEMIMKGT